MRRRLEGYGSGSELAAAFREPQERGDSLASDLYRVPDFFEDLGRKERIGLIPLEVVDHTLGSAVVYQWQYWEETVLLIRERIPIAYENFEHLAGQIALLRRPGVA